MVGVLGPVMARSRVWDQRSQREHGPRGAQGQQNGEGSALEGRGEPHPLPVIGPSPSLHTAATLHGTADTHEESMVSRGQRAAFKASGVQEGNSWTKDGSHTGWRHAGKSHGTQRDAWTSTLRRKSSESKYC